MPMSHALQARATAKDERGHSLSSLIYSRKRLPISPHEMVNSVTLVGRVQEWNILCGSNIFCGRLLEAGLWKIPTIEGRSGPRNDAEEFAGFRGRVCYVTGI